MIRRCMIPGWVRSLMVFLFLCCLVTAIKTITREQRPSDEATARVQRAVTRAAVHCFALEGAYPPNLQYLKDNYYLIVDESRYYCELETFGANVRPNVIIVPLGDRPE